MTTVVKSLIWLVAAGGSVGLGVGSYYMMKPKTLLEKFTKENIEVLDYSETSDQHPHKSIWDTNLTEYQKSENTSVFAGLETNNADLSKLKGECKKHLESSSEDVDESVEVIVKKWCTKTS